MSRPVYVVVPYVHRGVEERIRALRYVTRYWTRTLPTVLDGEYELAELVVSGDDPFSWASALNSAISGLPEESIVIHSDPDSYVPGRQALEAVRQADGYPGLIVAFTEYLYLTEAWTRGVLDGRADPFSVRPAVDWRGEKGVGNVTVYSRATWLAAGGYDERFDGAWGGADACFAYAAGKLVAPVRRVIGPMFHLWHPRLPESEPGGPGYVEQFAFVGEYRDAPDADAIRRILRERGTVAG